MVPKCRCGCGFQLEMRHAGTRELVASRGSWTTWRLRFRCPRCSRSVVRHFSVRSEEKVRVETLELYEREAAERLGPIAPNEEQGLLDNDRALEELKVSFSS